MLNLNLLQYQSQLVVTQKNQKRYIFDPIRKKKLVFTPEELVRQLFIQYLLCEKQFSSNKIAVEKAIVINDRTKRFDLLVYDNNFQPFILIECKASKVSITEATFEQAAWYNFELQADFLIVTNGRATYCCQMDYDNKSYTFQDVVPNPLK